MHSNRFPCSLLNANKLLDVTDLVSHDLESPSVLSVLHKVQQFGSQSNTRERSSNI